MTKNYPKKVSKIRQNPRRPTDNYEIIRHFDPLESNTTRHTDLQAQIPQINANINNAASRPRPTPKLTPQPLKVFTPIRRKTVITIPNAYLANTPTQNLVQGQNKTEHKNVPNPKFRSSSSSSVDVGLEKFANKAKVRSKSFHSGQSKQSNENKKPIKSFIENKTVSPRLKSENLKSITDPVLLRKELVLKSLKQEILENKRTTALEPRRPRSYSNSFLVNSPRLQKLKNEINKTKDNDILHKKIFITELKTEIAEYKRYNSYQVYTHSSSSQNHGTSPNSLNVIPKSVKGTALHEDSLERASKSSHSTPRDIYTFNILNPERAGGSSNVGSKSPQRSSLGESSKRKNSKDSKSEDLKSQDLSSPRRHSNSVRGSRSNSPNTSKGACCDTANPRQGSGSRRSSCRSNSPTRVTRSPQRSSLGEESRGKRKSKNSSEDIDNIIRRKSDGSKQGSFRRRSESGDRSLTGTDKDSILEASDYKRSDTTVGTEKTKSCCSYSDTDSFDDTVIRTKIEEANKLISRVKRALDKMKNKDGKKSRTASKESYRTSSTDIEQTIKQLKKDSEKLMIGDEPIPEIEPKRPRTKRGGRDSTSRSPISPEYSTRSVKRKERKKDADNESCSSMSKTFLKKDKDKQSAASSDEFIEESLPKVISQSRIAPDCGRMKLDLERPITRRNEAEDDLPEDHILDKFRNLPEEGQIVVNSSLEELQAKLQTISESTESMSTPRNKKRMDQGKGPIYPKDFKSCACNTENPGCHHKGSQTESDTVSVGTLCECPRNSKGIQTNWVSKNALTTYSSAVLFHLPEKKKSLDSANLEPHEITSQKSAECQVEHMSVIEVPPVPTHFKCHKCNQDLTEENIQGVSIPSKNKKLQKLTIKVLPPISIDQRMVVKQVLNFCITPQGDTLNLLPETENIGFVLFKLVRPDSGILFSNAQEGDIIEENESNPSNDEDDEEDDDKKISTSTSRENPVSSTSSVSRGNVSRLEAANKTSQFFMKLRDDAVKNLDLADDMADDTTRELDEETQQKLLVYKSYNLYDNPNRHDPGGLDAKSVERISALDAEFYKTFVNPTGKVSERDMPFRSRSRVLMGFESKGVQCGPSLMFGGQKDSTKSLNRPGTSTEKQSAKSLSKPGPSTEKQSTKSIDRPGTSTEKQSYNVLDKPGTSTEKPSTRSIDRPGTSAEKQSFNILDKPGTSTENPSTRSIDRPGTSTEKQSFNILDKPGTSTEKPSTRSIDRPGTSTEKQSFNILEKPGSSTENPSTRSIDRPGTSTEKQCCKVLDKPGTSTEKYSTRSIDRPGTSTEPSTQIESTKSLYRASKHENDMTTPSDVSAEKESQVTLMNMKSGDFSPIPQSIQRPDPKVSHTSALSPAEHLARPSKQENDYSTPSEITVTISYSDSSEGSTNCQNAKKDYGDSREVVIQNTMLEKLKSLEAGPKIQSEQIIDTDPTKPSYLDVEVSWVKNAELSTDLEGMGEVSSDWVYGNKALTVKDKDVIIKLQEKLKTVDPTSSAPKLVVKRERDSKRDTLEFIKELTRINTTDNVDGEQADENSPRNSQNVNYSLIDSSVLPKHLILAKNGRYKDEEDLFAQDPYPKPLCLKRRSESPKPTEHKDQEVQNNLLNAYPNEALNNYSPNTTISDSVTTNSLSEGEVRCKHTVSNGEIHVCKHGNLFYPTARRNILQRSNLTMNRTMSPQRNIISPRQILPRSNLTKSSYPICYTSTQRNVLARTLTRVSNNPPHNTPHPRKFDLLDPNLTIEKRRNYFNNWVTYYVKSQEIIESSTLDSTSSCSQNK